MGYGEGSYYKQKYRDEERWIYQAYHRDSDGKIFKIRGTGADKKQARERYNKLLFKRAGAERISRRPRGIKLDQAVALWLDEWQAGRKMGNVTREKYRANLNAVIQELKNPPVKAIDVTMVERYMNTLESQGFGNGAIRNRLDGLRTVIKECIKHDLADSNPFDKVGYTKPKPRVAATDNKMADAYKKAIYGMMRWAKANNHEAYLPTLVMTGLGLRASEMLGLEWQCFQGLSRGSNPTVTIKQQLQKKERGEVVRIKPSTKTASIREIPIPETIRNALKQRKKEHRANNNTPDWAENLVFLTPNGTVMTQSRLFKIWESAFKGYWEAEQITGSRQVRPRIHFCRHLFISELQDKGVDLLTIKAIAGHTEKSRVTQDTYVHISQEAKKAAINKIS